MRFEQIRAQEEEYPVTVQCETLEVSRSGYYDWRDRPESTRSRENRDLTEKIVLFFQESEETYGSPKIHEDLVEEGIRCSKNRVARLMRVNGLKSVRKKKFKVTTDSAHSHPVADNVLSRDFTADAPNQKWVGDITYIKTGEGWLYLAVVMDLFSRQIIGWSMDCTLHREIALNALDMALKGRNIAPELFHSDRGVQYASGEYQKELESEGIICSMSRRGNCWDNAVVESFFNTLKVERVYRKRYATRAEARRCIFDYVERFYNRKRRHSSIGYMSPVQFEKTRKLA